MTESTLAPDHRPGWAAVVTWLAAGVLLLLVGGGVTAVGTGAPGLETQPFTRISCHEVRTAKSGHVWHCFGMSPAQITAAAAEERRAREDALRAHRPGTTPHQPRTPALRTRLTFVAHDGRHDPAEVTATRVGSRWIAHAPGAVGTGVALLLACAGATALGVVRLRNARSTTGNSAAWSAAEARGYGALKLA